jgi:hypothetical protein
MQAAGADPVGGGRVCRRGGTIGTCWLLEVADAITAMIHVVAFEPRGWRDQAGRRQAGRSGREPPN